MGRSLAAAGLWSALIAARPAAAGDCPAHPGATEVTTHLEASRQAHHDKDAGKFTNEWKVGRRDALCTTESLSAHAVWMFNLLEGIEASAAGDPAHAIASYEAAQQVDPAFNFTDDWVFPEHFIRKQYDAARTRALAPEEPVWVPRRGTLTLNGVAAHARSPDLPVLWQFAPPHGAVSTGYVHEGQAPAWDAPWGSGAEQRHRWKRHLVVGAASTGAAAALSGAASLYFRAQVSALGARVGDGYTTGMVNQIDRAGAGMEVTEVAGAGLAGAALALGTAAVVVRW